MMRALAKNARLSALFVGLIPPAIGAAYVAVHGAPEPIVHDEFSYLLAADTFAHGRLANPPHPFWRHFQSINALVQPAYMSKYPPGQGLFLALGKVVTGQPISGAIFAVALAASAVYWMLLAFVAPEWALFGGLMAGCHPLLIYWLTNYWGGGVALLGGALLVGAWRRCLDEPRPLPGLVLGLGAAILSQSRSLEGLLLAAPLFVHLGWSLRRRAAAALGAAGVVLALAAAWTLAYDRAVTGDALELPYARYERTYNPAPLFIWQARLREVPDPSVPAIKDLWFEWNLAQHQRQRTFAGLLAALKDKLGDFDEAWLEPLPVKVFLALPLLGLCGLQAQALGLLWAAAGAVVFTLLFYYPHYSAPFGGLFFLLVTLGMRRAWDWRWRGRPLGRLAVIATVLWCLGRSVLFTGRKMENPRAAWSYHRREALDRMREMGGRHLVLVRYGPGASVHDDWVANEADIDAAPVIWAWHLSDEEDRRLEDSQPGRAVWDLEVVPPRPVFRLVRGPKP